ncbi:YIP1 family protein [Eubacteriales bacterium mix99]|jgi:sugar lactone lactonase YvrE/uncharacterized metal-binding protein
MKKRMIRSVFCPALLTLLMLLFLCPAAFASDAPYTTMTQDHRGRLVSSQDGYLPQNAITKLGGKELKKPGDIFIDGKNMLYIADTGNARVVRCTLEGEFLASIGEGVLKGPTGIFVDEKGNLYAADPRQGKIIVFSSDGKQIGEYGKPEGPLYGKKNKFVPKKLVVDAAGSLYVIAEGNTNGIAQIGEQKDFLGYFGANSTPLPIRDAFRRLISTKEQKQQLKRNVPPSPVNLAIDDRGLIYTVTQGSEANGVKKFNMAGINMLNNVLSDENIADVAVGSIENIFVVSATGYLYEYSREGDLLFLFGGSDDGKNRSGLFVNAAAIDVDASGHLYVLDQEAGKIQVFEQTEYADTVHHALRLYQEGHYVESKEPWEEVLRQNSFFDYAYRGLGQAYYKLEDYDRSLSAFRLAGDKDGYSDSFWEVRNVFLKNHLFLILIIFLVLYVFRKALQKLDRKFGILRPVRGFLSSAGDKRLVRELRFVAYVPKNPADAYYGIQRESKVSIFSSTLLYLVFFILYVADKYFSGFLFKRVQEGRFELGMDVALVFGIFFLFILCNYLVSSIRDGEGKLKDIYCSLAYATMPYLVLKPVVILLSHVLTQNEAFLIGLLNFIVVLAMAILIVVMVREIQNYSWRETFQNIGLTLFTMFLFIVAGVIIFALIHQVVDFVVSIWKEVSYRVS